MQAFDLATRRQLGWHRSVPLDSTRESHPYPRCRVRAAPSPIADSPSIRAGRDPVRRATSDLLQFVLRMSAGGPSDDPRHLRTPGATLADLDLDCGRDSGRITGVRVFRATRADRIEEVGGVAFQWLRRLFGPKDQPGAADVLPQPQAASQVVLPSELLWLADAPMFIDEKQVEAFYDAVLRPDYEGESLTLSDQVTTGTKLGANATVGVAIPWLAKSEGGLSGERTRSRAAGEQATLNVVTNPYRHLLALAVHYATNQADRLVLRRHTGEAFIGGEPSDNSWYSDAYIQASPRAMVLLDLPPKSRFIPTALELANGKVLTLFDDFAARLEERGARDKPDYPGSGSSLEARDEYWNWFAVYYNDRAAGKAIEAAVDEGTKIAWVDFRLPLGGDEGPHMHLHLAPRGVYDTGIFAYNLVNRGFKHGLRVVGTLKSEPDLNVLGIFER